MSSREELLAQAKKIERDRLLAQAKGIEARRSSAIAQGEKDRPGLADSSMRGGAQGLTFGLADEAYGVFGGAINSIKDDKPFGEAYREARDYARRSDEKSQAANPKAYGAAELGGGVATSFVPGLGVLNAGKGAGVAATAGKGALGGGLTGLGMSEADMTKGEIPEALVDTAKGAALGGAIGGGIAKAQKSLNPKVLKHLAERRAFKAAIGNQGKIYDEAIAKGNVNAIGRDLLDDGTVKFGSDAKSIAGRAAGVRKSTGKAIGDVLEESDELLANRGIIDDHSANNYLANPRTGSGMDGSKLADKMRAYADQIDSPNNQSVVANIRRQADDYEAMGMIPLKEANRLKSQYRWKFGEGQALNQEATNKLKGIISDEMEETVGLASRPRAAVSQIDELARTGTDDVAVAAGDPVADAVSKVGKDLGPNEQRALASTLKDESLGAVPTAPGKSPLDRYVALKGKYERASTAANGAKKLAARQEKNRTFGLTDNMWGGIGLMTMGPKGLALAAVNKIARERGSSMMAVGLDKTAKLLEKTPGVFGPLAPVLAKAAKNGSLPAVHYVLMKNNPEYRDLVLRQAEEKDGP